MKLNDSYDEPHRGFGISGAALICFLVIFTVIACVLLINADKLRKRVEGNTVSDKISAVLNTLSDNLPVYTDEPTASVSASASHITVSDLDFYDMYKDRETDSTALSEPEPSVTKEPEPDPATDGKHTLIKYEDGTCEWVAISPYLAKNSYDYTNLYNVNGRMKYYEGDKCTSFFGVDISKEQDYIDFVKLKRAGCDFVMIRVGARGYQSGQLTIDDYFTDNIKRATDAGLSVGVYFLSQAISDEEAVEEANLVIESVKDYSLTYPVAFVMQYAKNDNSRIETLTRNEKTFIARAFLNKIKEAGLKPMLYGEKTWLIKYLDLSKLLSDFDIWFSETDTDMPTFPYRFAMWRYGTSGTIDGISGTVNFDISFYDYSLK